MNHLIVFVALCGIPVALGPAIDRFMLDRDKGRLHILLLRYWDRLDSIKIIDLASLMAIYVSKFHAKYLGEKLISLRSMAVTLFVSFFITLLMMFYAEFEVSGQWRFPYFWSSWEFIFGFISVNVFFDVLTYTCTFLIMQEIKKGSCCKNAVLILLGVIGAYLCCFACGYSFEELHQLHYPIQTVDYFPVGRVFGEYELAVIAMNKASIFSRMAATALIPFTKTFHDKH